MKEEITEPPPKIIRTEWPQLQLTLWGLLLGVFAFVKTSQPGIFLAFLLIVLGLAITEQIRANLQDKSLETRHFFLGLKTRIEKEVDLHKGDFVFEIWPEKVEGSPTGRMELQVKQGRKAFRLQTYSTLEEAQQAGQQLVIALGGALRLEDSHEEECF
ncbi:MAG: hypothetical protein H6581_10120 [Bacteroidia bacterium]|nr:hypothetical protein [Bacteroidia bacterium]